MAIICGAGVTRGDLQLIWDESNKAVDGYKVYRVDGGGHRLLGTSTARYYLVPKPSEGYNNLCFAVEAYVGSKTSADSRHYCYAPGATVTTRSFKPSHTVTEVDWKARPNITCSLLSGSAFFQDADKDFGPAFTAFFPFLLNNPQMQGRVGVNGVHAGNEAAVIRNISAHLFGVQGINLGYHGAGCPAVGSTIPNVVSEQITALGGAAFDLRELANHKLYSASLTLKASQTVGFASGKARLSNGGWCPIYVGAANREWWLAPLGNLTYNKSGRVNVVTPPTTIDVTAIVSAWASVRYANNYGFIVTSTLPSGAVPTASNACLTKFSRPSLQVVYF
jgi:hypothetical protein